MQPTPIAPFLKQQWQLTGFDGDVSQLENSSQNAKNVVLLLLGEPEEPEGVLGRGELGSVVDAVDQRVLALGQVPELKKSGSVGVRFKSLLVPSDPSDFRSK